MKKILCFLLTAAISYAAQNDITGLNKKNAGNQPKPFVIPAAVYDFYTAPTKADQRTALQLNTPSGWTSTDKVVTSETTGGLIRFDIGALADALAGPITSQADADMIFYGKGTGESRLSGPDFFNYFAASTAVLRAVVGGQLSADFVTGDLYDSPGGTSSVNFYSKALTGNWSMSGIFSHPGSIVINPNNMASHVWDVTKGFNIDQLVGASTTITLSNPAHVTGKWLYAFLKGTVGSDCTVTLNLAPDIISMDRQGTAITTFLVPASPDGAFLQLFDDGTNYYMWGDPGTSTGRIIVATGKVFTVNNTLTMSGTDGTTMTFPTTSASIARTDAAQSFTGVNTFTSPVINTKIQLPTAAGSSTLTTSGDAAVNTTNKQIGIYSGAKEVAVPLILHQTWSFDPKAVCDGTIDRLFLLSTGISEPFGIHILAWKASFEADPTTEAVFDLKRADAFIGVANTASMDVCTTAAGISSESASANINGDAVVANGKVIYLDFGTPYTEANHQVIFEMWWEIEED